MDSVAVVDWVLVDDLVVVLAVGRTTSCLDGPLVSDIIEDVAIVI